MRGFFFPVARFLKQIPHMNSPRRKQDLLYFPLCCWKISKYRAKGKKRGTKEESWKILPFRAPPPTNVGAMEGLGKCKNLEYVKSTFAFFAQHLSLSRRAEAEESNACFCTASRHSWHPISAAGRQEIPQSGEWEEDVCCNTSNLNSTGTGRRWASRIR